MRRATLPLCPSAAIASLPSWIPPARCAEGWERRSVPTFQLPLVAEIAALNHAVRRASGGQPVLPRCTKRQVGAAVGVADAPCGPHSSGAVGRGSRAGPWGAALCWAAACCLGCKGAAFATLGSEAAGLYTHLHLLDCLRPPLHLALHCALRDGWRQGRVSCHQRAWIGSGGLAAAACASQPVRRHSVPAAQARRLHSPLLSRRCPAQAAFMCGVCTHLWRVHHKADEAQTAGLVNSVGPEEDALHCGRGAQGAGCCGDRD